MNGLCRAGWHGFGFVCVIGAVSACASTASLPRSAADDPASPAAAAGAPRSAHSDIGDTRAAPAAPATASSDARDNADLPWLSPSHVGAAVRAHHASFQACQALGDLESQREDGTVTVGWAVRANGSVNGVTLGASTFASEGINACVLDVAKEVTFPPSASPVQVSWTVEFRGEPQAPVADVTLR
jgi:hypothetical protein